MACWRKEKVLLWRVVLERGPRKGRVASATEALLSPGDNPKWMELFGGRVASHLRKCWMWCLRAQTSDEGLGSDA